jgi:hypothetical protein
MGSSGSKHPTVLQTMLANFREGFSGNYGVWMKLAKLQTFCDVEWPTFNVGWPAEDTLDLATIAHVRDIVVGDPGHPDQFMTPVASWPPAHLTGCFHAPWLQHYATRTRLRSHHYPRQMGHTRLDPCNTCTSPSQPLIS